MDDPKDPSTLIERLIAGGMKQSEIVRALKARGVEVTQPTISRIKAGADTRFEVGMGLLDIYQSQRSAARRALAS